MSYQVIARKWRPQSFEEVTGQEAITHTLRNAIEHDRLHHAYLFSGARGVGKTTTARLLAKALNCHKTSQPNPVPCSYNDPDSCPSCREIAESRSIDVLEFDAASHTGVDAIRDIILEGINSSAARDRFKIFIIDEVHMLSNSSFNALLKTLEEPPPNVAFIMATTELHKVPDTISSRCQEFEFRTIPVPKIFARLKLIADAEKIKVTDEALREIARSGEGSMRDAQSNFDQVISFSGDAIDVLDVSKALGIAGAEMLTRIVTAIAHNQPVEAINIVDDLISRGHDLRSFCRDLLSFVRDLLVTKIAGHNEALLETAALGIDELQKFAQHFTESDLVRFFNSLAETELKLRDATQSRYVLEIGLVKLVEMRRVVAIEGILERLSRLEAKAAAGEISTEAPAPAEKKTLKSEIAPPADVPFPATTGISEPLPTISRFREAAPTIAREPEMPPQPDFAPVDRRDEKIVAEPSLPAIDEPAPKRNLIAEMLASMPLKLLPITSEELAHVDDNRLDAAYEHKLRLSGDDLFPIHSANALAAMLTAKTEPAAVESGGGAGTATRLKPEFAIPEFDNDADDAPIPVLPENPTEADLLQYAEQHPTVRRVVRAFRGKIVEVRPKQ
ncbi:MAG: DNA polymerase III subunit gamma/tau [Acidobacteria bacterium]|nr:DNA polymerase III subunit gamma/tau [Acidobacteriota bacterium]